MVVVWAGASNTGAAASADTGSRDSSILPVSRMLTMRLAFIKFRSFRAGFIRGCHYHKYTTNWAKTKEILREWGLKLREWLKKRGEVVHIIIRNPFRQSLRLCHLPQGDGNPLRLTTFASSPEGGARPLRRSRARFPLLSPTVTSSPGAGEVFPQRESQAVNLDAEVLGTKRKLPVVLLPLPLGEVASPTGLDGEGAHR